MREKLQKLCWFVVLVSSVAALIIELQEPASKQDVSVSVETLPAFMPKDYVLIGTLQGIWSLKKSKNDYGPPSFFLKFETVALKMTGGVWRNDSAIGIKAPAQEEPMRWEMAYHPPFKLKTILGISIFSGTGFACDAENATLWFDDGESMTVPRDMSTLDYMDIDDDKKPCFMAWTPIKLFDNKGDFFEPKEAYALTSIIQKHKPVALSQGKKVLLIKSPDETPIEDFQKKIDPKLEPDFFKKLKKQYEDGVTIR